MMKRDNIVLIGMPGSGKSTVGVVLAKATGRGFVDVDLVICALNGGTLQEIVDRNTHDGFLRLEAEAAMTINSRHSVIATGGSMVCSEDAMEYLKNIGRIVYLKASLDELGARITNLKTRGIAFRPGETLADLYAQRTPLYEKWADMVIDSKEAERIEDIVVRIKHELDKH